MKISETPFSFLGDDTIAEFGEEKGKDIYKKADSIYTNLDATSDYKGNEAIRNHMQMKLLPPLAYYKALLTEGYDKNEALSYVRKETRKTAEKKKARMQKMARLPFTYLVYRLFVNAFMKKNFPPEGWETEWVRCDGKEIHFNLHSCLYHDICNENDCPELCSVYCENDNISFSGLEPKIRFKRSGTLPSGASFCDFHFINRKTDG